MQQTQRRYVIDDTQKDPILQLPTSDIDIHLLQAFKQWNDSLATYGLEISTGPVVPFRALNILTDTKHVENGSAVPLLWLQHVRRMSINWPLAGFNKPQAEGQKQLVKNVTQNSSWSETSQVTITIHNMMHFMKVNYGRSYAENTREVVRRQVIHQFEQARLIDRNPDDRTRPTNSPNTCYALTSEALQVLQQYGSYMWENAVTHFLAQHGALWEQYQRSRQIVALPLKLADGNQFYLTPGKHNELQIDIVEKSGQLGAPITNHDKLPDVILYREDKNWLYLIEAVTSHGPVSHKRKYELEKLLQSCTASPIYITAFQDEREFRRRVGNIAWESEVWIAETPEHLIHYNGDKFLGPYDKTPE